jgi:hypothetical protein
MLSQWFPGACELKTQGDKSTALGFKHRCHGNTFNTLPILDSAAQQRILVKSTHQVVG